MSIAPITVACGICCGPVCFTLECETRGGIAELCGFPEFDGYKSDPPRYYLHKTIGGSVVLCDYHSPGGEGPCLDDPCDSPIGSKVTAQLTVTGLGPDDGVRAVTGTIIQMGRIAPGVIRLGVDAAFATEVPGRGTGKLRFNSNVFYSQFDNNTAIVFANVTEGATITFAADVEVFFFGKTDSLSFTACIPLPTSTRYKYTGKASYDPNVSCSVLASDTRELVTITPNEGCNPPTSGGSSTPTTTAFEPLLSAYVAASSLNSGTFKGQVSSATCASDARATECDRHEQLSVEDTESDAIVRLFASPLGDWNGWRIVDDGNGTTCLNPACCRATYEERTGKTFEIQEARYRGTVKDLTGFQPVEVKIHIYRKKRSAAVYELYLTRTYMLIADLSGQAQVSDDVPNAVGYDTYAGRCSFKLV